MVWMMHFLALVLGSAVGGAVGGLVGAYAVTLYYDWKGKEWDE